MPGYPALEPGFHDRSLPEGGAGSRWVLYLPPDYDPDREWPLVLFLHGRGEEGTDGRLQTEVGLGPALRRHPERWPAIVVFPQKPADRDGWTAWEPRVLMALMAARHESRVDPDRITLTGVSMGGFGAWMIAPRHRDLFAAIAPVCGGGDPADAPDLASLPTWAFHGTDDPVVPVEHTRRMVEAVRAAGGQPRMTLYEGVRHDSWERAYDEPELPAWLLEQRLPQQGP